VAIPNMVARPTPIAAFMRLIVYGHAALYVRLPKVKEVAETEVGKSDGLRQPRGSVRSLRNDRGEFFVSIGLPIRVQDAKTGQCMSLPQSSVMRLYHCPE